MRRRRRKWLLRMVLKLTPKRATTTPKTTTVRKQKVVALKYPPPFTLEIPVNIVRILKCTELLLARLLQDLSDLRSPDPRGEKEGFLRCHDFGAITHKKAKTLETNFYSPSKEENEEED